VVELLWWFHLTGCLWSEWVSSNRIEQTNKRPIPQQHEEEQKKKKPNQTKKIEKKEKDRTAHPTHYPRFISKCDLFHVLHCTCI
jgi:hypothetical protein